MEALLPLAAATAAIAAWITHFFWTVATFGSDRGITFGQALLGVIGIFFVPLGITNGFVLWARAFRRSSEGSV